MINRSISTPIAVAETKDELIAFCHTEYGDDIPFDDNGKTPTIQIPMGKASFQIKTVARLWYKIAMFHTFCLDFLLVACIIRMNVKFLTQWI